VDTVEFATVRFSQVATAEGRSLVLKERPAIYAWYRSLNLISAAESSAKFLAKLEGLLSAKLSDACSARLGFLYEVTIQEMGGPLGERSRALLEQLSTDPDARIRLAAILQTATYLQAPLYVGKTVNLRRRIGEHLTGASGLIERLSAAALPIETCDLRYRYIQEEEVAVLVNAIGEDGSLSRMDKLAILIEEILTRLGPSAFVRRPG
jgi:hypothetical protein